MRQRRTVLFTIASKNYLAYVRVLMQSVARFHPEFRLVLCLADTVDGAFDTSTEVFRTIQASELGIRYFDDMALRYDIMEFNTAIKPFVVSWLFDKTDADTVIYLDPDIRAYSRFDSLERILTTDVSMVLTPHLLRPIEDGKNPNDYHMLQAGVFNLGFAAFNRTSEAIDFVHWWGRRLETSAHADFSRNLFTDQRWCDLAPSFVERLHVLRDPGYNVAYWNIKDRRVLRVRDGWSVNDHRLAFFHFSGVNPRQENVISKHQDRFSWSDLPDLKPLFDEYRAELIGGGWDSTRTWPYAYSKTREGLRLTSTMRAVYAQACRASLDLEGRDSTSLVISLCNEAAPDLPVTDGERPVTRLMQYIYDGRPDLKATFDLTTIQGRSAFHVWMKSSGPREYGLPVALVGGEADKGEMKNPTTVSDASANDATQSPSVIATLPSASLERTKTISETWHSLPESVQRRLAVLVDTMYSASAGPAAAGADTAVVDTAASDGTEASFVAPEGRRIENLDRPAALRQFLEGRYISRLMEMIWTSRTDLQAAFPLATREGQEAFMGWYAASAAREYGLSPRIPTLGPGCAEVGLENARASVLPGANLIGYAHAELGMGEHVRMSAAALQDTSVDFGVVNFNVGVASRQEAAVDHGKMVHGNPHAANIFHINADQMLLAYCHLGRQFFTNRYNIGYWAWELAKCPAAWLPVINMVDEIWAPSRFIKTAFEEVSDVPVVLMPLCVTLPAFQTLPRRTFGLPDNAYVFLYTFDFFSFLDRKNPFAAIRSFKRAFPRSREDVRLVLKIMNGDPGKPLWHLMESLIDGDPRIVIINRTMRRDELLALFETSNCFISLHRSEGFGRGPAEAMYLGKPVIVTNYSGNTDFTLADNSCLVDYRLIPVEAGQYPLHEGQVWADADVDHAAWYMRRLCDDPSFGDSIGARGRAFVKTNFSQRAVGEMYATRLRKLRLSH
jgi:glycosyltransferase involved in cell wall biosynthesis